MDDELIDVIDEQGDHQRTTLKNESHKEGSLHAVVIGTIVTPDGKRMMIRQAADRQDAGQLVNPVGGHVKAGESLEDAMRREAFEELGWGDITLTKIGAAIFSRTVLGRKENHFFNVYSIWSDEPINLNEEGVEIATMTPEEHNRIVKEEPHLFGDAHHFVVQTFPEHYGLGV